MKIEKSNPNKKEFLLIVYIDIISIFNPIKNIYIQIRFFHRKKLNSLSKKKFVAIISKFLN
jgi:hypothetical protein